MSWIRFAPLAAATLLICVVASCARPPKGGGALPSVTSTEPKSRVSTKMDSVSEIPTARPVVGSAPAGMRIVICHFSPAGNTNHPPLYVVDGVILGLRPDSTIDHDAAQRALGQISAQSIVSIEVLKGEGATQRFGPGAHEGAILILTAQPAAAREKSKP